MSFKPGMPESGSTLGSTRKLFVEELAGMRSTAAANHVDQNGTDGNGAGKGKHLFCQFKNVLVNLTAATELAFYNRTNSGNQRFFIRQPSNGTEIQISGVDPVAEESGCTFLPGGLLLQWGTVNTKKPIQVYFKKQGADGFTLLNVIAVNQQFTKATDITDAVGYNYNNPSVINPNDGLNLFTKFTHNVSTALSYLVIGTMP